jgi:16S rRNA (cytidine1402-2'-O)-methyltransferase
LRELAGETATLIFYLPARKAQEFLSALQDAWGERPVVIARELTKIHEEFIRGTTSELIGALASRTLKGELTVLVGGKEK